jgi:hypothetical protein
MKTERRKMLDGEHYAPSMSSELTRGCRQAGRGRAISAAVWVGGGAIIPPCVRIGSRRRPRHDKNIEHRSVKRLRPPSPGSTRALPP